MTLLDEHSIFRNRVEAAAHHFGVKVALAVKDHFTGNYYAILIPEHDKDRIEITGPTITAVIDNIIKHFTKPKPEQLDTLNMLWGGPDNIPT